LSHFTVLDLKERCFRAFEGDDEWSLICQGFFFQNVQQKLPEGVSMP
jgi:hypothetical protein